MSIKLQSAVWKMTNLQVLQDSTNLLVMLKLADNASDEGMCWPSMENIARQCRISKRQAQRVVKSLVTFGMVSIESRGTGKRSTRYIVLPHGEEELYYMPPSRGDTDVRGDTHDTPRGDTHVTPGVTPMSPKPSVEPSVEPSVSADADSLLDNSPQQKEPDPPTFSYKDWHPSLCWVIYGNEGAKVDQRTIGRWVKECKALHDAGRTPEDLHDWYDRIWTQTWPGNTGERPTINQVRQGLPAVDTLENLFPPEKKEKRVVVSDPGPEYYEPLP